MSSIAQTPLDADPPALSDMLRGVAQTLDKLGVLVLHLAATVDQAPRADDPLLTVAEVAAALGAGARFVRRECARGKLEAVQLGRAYRVRTSALRAYERRRTS